MPSADFLNPCIAMIALCFAMPAVPVSRPTAGAPCPQVVAVSEADLAQAKGHRPERIGAIRSYLAARSAAAQGDRTAALAALNDLAGKGAPVLPGPQDPLAQYSTDPAFRPALEALRTRLVSTANGRVVREVRRPPIAAESIAYDPAARRFYLSNWFDNSIYMLTLTGRIHRYVALPELTPNGVAIDGPRHRLWFVATNAFRDGAPSPRSKLWQVDLRTGAKQSFEAAGAKGFNDLAVAPNGDVYVTDTPGGALYVLRAGALELERFLPDESFQQPNGVAMGDGGRYLFVAQGLDLLRIDLVNLGVEAVQVPNSVETVGTDGLRFQNGKLYAVQNLLTRGTVVEIGLDATRTKATSYRFLDRANPLFDLPTSGTFAEGRLYLVAGTQLYRYGRDKQPEPSEIKPLRLLAYSICG
jgi:hypothetical protein